MPEDDVSTESASTHERLLAEATALFAERGYGGTSMADIAGRVGVRKASLYNYYSRKEDLLLDLLERSIRAWGEASGTWLEGPGRAEDRLRRHLEAAVAFTAERPHEVAIVRLAASLIGGELGERVTELLQASLADYHRRLERFFAAAVASGEVEPAEPRELALSWQVWLDGLLMNLVFAADDSRGELQALVPSYWRFCWRGLAGRPAERDEREEGKEPEEKEERDELGREGG